MARGSKRRVGPALRCALRHAGFRVDQADVQRAAAACRDQAHRIAARLVDGDRYRLPGRQHQCEGAARVAVGVADQAAVAGQCAHVGAGARLEELVDHAALEAHAGERRRQRRRARCRYGRSHRLRARREGFVAAATAAGQQQAKGNRAQHLDQHHLPGRDLKSRSVDDRLLAVARSPPGWRRVETDCRPAGPEPSLSRLKRSKTPSLGVDSALRVAAPWPTGRSLGPPPLL